MGAQSRAAARMHTLALPKSVSYIELGPKWPLALYELAFLIKKKIIPFEKGDGAPVDSLPYLLRR